jgi:hypothetical protein
VKLTLGKDAKFLRVMHNVLSLLDVNYSCTNDLNRKKINKPYTLLLKELDLFIKG